MSLSLRHRFGGTAVQIPSITTRVLFHLHFLFSERQTHSYALRFMLPCILVQFLPVSRGTGAEGINIVEIESQWQCRVNVVDKDLHEPWLNGITVRAESVPRLPKR